MNDTEFEQLRLTEIIRACSVCKAPTFWRKKGQKTLGMCPDHSRYRPDNKPLAPVVRSIVESFPDAVIASYSTPAYPPDSWAEPIMTVARGRFVISGVPFRITALARHPDAGPCVGCGGLIKRYGPEARLHCSVCAPTGGN